MRDRSMNAIELTTWGDWASRFPRTKVLSLQTGYVASYGGHAYASYFRTDQLMFNVIKRTDRPRRFKNKELLAVVYAGRQARAYAVRDVCGAAGHDGVVLERLGDLRIRLTCVDEGKSLRVETADGGEALPVAYMFWFALSAMQPDVPLFTP